MRVAHAIVLASTAVVATCVIVMQSLLAHEPAAHTYPMLPPPAYLVPAIGPTHGFSLPDQPTVACPPATTADGTRYAWIDPLGQRHHLLCDASRSITRSRGIDGVFGTEDDVCFDMKVSCSLMPAPSRDNL